MKAFSVTIHVMLTTLEKEVRRNLKYNIVVNLFDGSLFGIALGFASFSTILPLFVATMTSSALLIGLVPAVHSVGWQLPQLFTAQHVARLRRYKWTVLLTTIHERAPFLGFAIVALLMPFIGAKISLGLTFLLLTWQGLGGGFTANPWTTMISKIIPPESRGTFFGLQAGLANLFLSGAAIGAGYLLDYFDAPFNFAACFLAAVFFFGLSWIALSRTHEPEDTEKVIPETQPHFWEHAKTILRGNPNFRWFLGARFLSQFAAMGFSFYIIYALRGFHMDAVTAGFLTATLTISQTVANIVMGWLGDRVGHRAMLILGAAAAFFSSILAWNAASILWFYPIFILTGFANVSIWTNGLTMTVDFGSEIERPMYIGLSQTLTAPATILAPILGGWIADLTGFVPTFIISTVLSVVLFGILIFLVKDPRKKGASMSLIQEKTHQAIEILKEQNIDLWLTFVRETSGVRDPALDLLVGPNDLTWQSALMLTQKGEKLAIIGNLEKESLERLKVYEPILGYDTAVRELFRETITRLDPDRIAVNTSRNNVHADGLTHAMYEILCDYLAGTPYAERLTSAEPIINALRGRKTPAEQARIRRAVEITDEIFQQTFDFMQIGMTELEVADFMQAQVKARGLKLAWPAENCPAVNSGPNSPVGHSGPTDIQLARGHIVHFDFGVKYEDYCSDIQRVAYLLREGETEAPVEVQRGFITIRTAVEKARAAMKAGVTGNAIDILARDIVMDAGYPSYPYALGHQLGRVAHDGGALLGPLWEKYGDSPKQVLEVGQVFTIEPGLAVAGYGHIGLEEDVVITAAGAEYLGRHQAEIVLIKR